MCCYSFVIILLVVGTATTKANRLYEFSDDFINHINSKQTLWTAGRNFHKNIPLSYFKSLTGALRDNGLDYLPEIRYKNVSIPLPRNFDLRKQWSFCPTLKQIRDQGSCGSCWAVSAASAMTDRICIRSKGWKHFYFSEDDILSCCTECGAGCNGGELSSAWVYTRLNGTVSGGPYDSFQGCRPYEIAPCEHSISGYRQACGHVDTPRCKKMCQAYYKKKYSEDKKKIGKVYKFNNNLDLIIDIFKYGPVTTSFRVYTDFFHYKKGIYRHQSGTYMGEHAVKLLGWGIKKNVKYWLAANSWNTDWGMGGFFKIIRGENHCRIESNALAGRVIP